MNIQIVLTDAEKAKLFSKIEKTCINRTDLKMVPNWKEKAIELLTADFVDNLLNSDYIVDVWNGDGFADIVTE